MHFSASSVPAGFLRRDASERVPPVGALSERPPTEIEGRSESAPTMAVGHFPCMAVGRFPCPASVTAPAGQRLLLLILRRNLLNWLGWRGRGNWLY